MHAESGCRMYELFKGAEEDCFVMIEWWADAAAIEAHMKTPHVQQGREQNSFSFICVVLF